MKFLSLFVATLGLSLSACNGAKSTHVWPMPVSMHVHPEHLRINSKHFQIVQQVTSKGHEQKCDVVEKAIARYTDRMFTQDCHKLNSKIGAHHVEYMHDDVAPVANLTKVLLRHNDGKCEQFPHSKMVENYKIVVNKDGAEIVADSVWGILRGLESFAQLVQPVGIGHFSVPIVSIDDTPRFSHRGMMIDSSRHFLSLQSIYDTLDAMELNKMNVLHWHLVDDQSFPFVSKKFPDLSTKGAFNPHTHVYTESNVRSILEYARLRGIRVLTEFDTPGHTQSWGKGVKGLLTECYGKDGKPNGKHGPINPVLPSTYKFIQDFFSEVAERFPDQYMHLGGDEVPFDCWASNPSIQKFMAEQKLKKYEEVESYYIQKMLDIVGGMNRSYIVWQEVFDNNVKLAPDTVVHVWKGHNQQWLTELEHVVTTGHYNALISSPWYLNYISYGSDWEKYYSVEPLAFNATEAQKKQVLGGEACMWGEWVDSSNLISRTWPRASAVAERLWSPASVNQVQDARDRFRTQHCRMQRMGLRVEPITGPGFCPCDYAL